MNYRKRGPRAFGLSLLVALGLLAATATGTQASGKISIEDPVGGSWTEETVEGKGENSLTGRFLILKLNIEIFCHKLIGTGTILPNGTGTATLEVQECLVQSVTNDGTDTLFGDPCEIDDIAVKVKVLEILHEGNVALTTEQHNQSKGQPYILFAPADGLTFATILNHTECALPEIAIVKGCYVAKVENPDVNEVVKLGTSRGMLDLFGCKLTYGSHEAHLDTEAVAELSGVNAGKKWGAV